MQKNGRPRPTSRRPTAGLIDLPREPVAQFAFEHLADVPARQFVDEDEVGEALGLADRGVDAGLQGAGIGAGGDDKGHRGFAPAVRRDADDGGFDDAGLRIDYSLIEGDLDKFEGTWTFSAVDGKTEVCLSVDYDFGLPELTELIGPTLHEKVAENCEMMLSGMKSLVEAAKL